MSKVSYIISNSGNVNLIVDGNSHTVAVDHVNYSKIIERLKAEDYTDIEKLLDIGSSIVQASQGKVTVLEGCITFNGKEVINPLTHRILRFVKEELPFKPMINFLENLMENPSRTSIQELYLFLENNTLPITEDGHFLAYKKVRDDYMDFYSNSIDNSVGETPEVERNEVDDIRDNLCSNGLHFCSMGYLPKYHGGNGRVMIVKINPKDVVSIPSDYDNAKGRCCKYEVVDENTDAGKEYKDAFDSAVVSSDGGEFWAVETDDQCDYCSESLDNCTCADVCEECEECGYANSECICEEVSNKITRPKTITEVLGKFLGVKPNGSAYHNKRDSNGKFVKRS